MLVSISEGLCLEGLLGAILFRAADMVADCCSTGGAVGSKEGGRLASQLKFCAVCISRGRLCRHHGISVGPLRIVRGRQEWTLSISLTHSLTFFEVHIDICRWLFTLLRAQSSSALLAINSIYFFFLHIITQDFYSA